MIAPETRVKLVRFTSPAVGDLLKRHLGETGTVEEVRAVAGRTKVKVRFRVGFGKDWEGFWLWPEELEVVEAVTE